MHRVYYYLINVKNSCESSEYTVTKMSTVNPSVALCFVGEIVINVKQQWISKRFNLNTHTFLHRKKANALVLYN